MDILTDGRTFLHADALGGTPGLRADFGWQATRPDQRAPAHWWGFFQRGDELALEVAADSGPVRVEVLDACFRPLAAAAAIDAETTGALRLRLRHSGFVHLRFGADGALAFRLVRERAARAPSWLARLLGRLPQAPAAGRSAVPATAALAMHHGGSR